MAGGFFMLIAALATIFIVKDVGEETIPVRADEKELLTIQESAQPVPSSGLIE